MQDIKCTSSGRYPVRSSNQWVHLAYEIYESKTTLDLHPSLKTINLVLTPGGQQGMEKTRKLAIKLIRASSKFLPHLRILIWDRRNIGNSDLCFNLSARPVQSSLSSSLLYEEANDLHLLLKGLGIPCAFLYGSSSGSRTSVLLTQLYPTDVLGVILSPPTGGTSNPNSARDLAYKYYQRYIPAVETYGMTGVLKVKQSHYSKLIKTQTHNEKQNYKQKLLTIDPRLFLNAMQLSCDHITRTGREPFIGLTRSELQQINTPALVIHNGDLTDTLHVLSDAKQVSFSYFIHIYVISFLYI